jgi:hypothetical protein
MDSETTVRSDVRSAQFGISAMLGWLAAVAIVLSGIVSYGLTSVGVVLSGFAVGIIISLQRRKYRCAAGLSLGLALLWTALQILGPYTSLKNRVRWQVGTDRLQSWAIESLENPPPLIESTSDMSIIDPAHLPVDIRQLSTVGNFLIIPANGDIDRHIVVACGGGFCHWGLHIGRPGFKPWPDSQYKFEELSDGVWGFHE